MNIIRVAGFLGNVGFGVIKNSGRILQRAGQAVVGIVTESDELVESGVKNMGRGTLGLGIGGGMKKLRGEKSDEDSDVDVDL